MIQKIAKQHLEYFNVFDDIHVYIKNSVPRVEEKLCVAGCL